RLHSGPDPERSHAPLPEPLPPILPCPPRYTHHVKTRTTLIWLVVAIVFGLPAYLVLNRPSSPPGADGDAAAGGTTPAGSLALPGFDPSTLRALTVATPDGRTQRVERAADPAEWS